MKKIVSTLVALSLVLTPATGVMAAENVSKGGSDSADVTGTYKSQETASVYSVDLAWEGLNFTYNDAYQGDWNPKTHTYENSRDAAWESEGKITITNHSNAGITVSMSYEPKPAFETASMVFDKNDVEVATADNGTNNKPGQAVKQEVTVTPTGTLPENTQNAVIGTITVSVN